MASNHQAQPTVYDHRLAGQVARPHDSDGGVGDVIGRGRAMERCHRRNDLPLRVSSLGPRGVNLAGCDGVHPDGSARELRQKGREVVHGGLGDGVGERAPGLAHTSDRGDVDDPTDIGFSQQWQRGL